MATILIVEDDPVGAEVATVICRAAGHDVAHAVNGREALARLHEARYDVVLMDVQMPELDGISLTRLLRADPRFAALPIVGCTAKAGAQALAEMRDAGMDSVVTKPYRNATLRDAVAAAIAGAAHPAGATA